MNGDPGVTPRAAAPYEWREGREELATDGGQGRLGREAGAQATRAAIGWTLVRSPGPSSPCR